MLRSYIRDEWSQAMENTSAYSIQEAGGVKRIVFPRNIFQSKLATSGQYRPDIDGLRAVAVLTVLFFHTEISGFSGGFVGVDIFYVISGYLITSIVARDEAAGRFSLVSFYDRRLRRIFPALFGVVFFSVLVSGILLAPSDLAFFGKSLLAMTFFVSNIFFKRTGGTGGYFAADVHPQVLLHTWSLSVEEQFYLFFPTSLILLTRLAKKHVSKFLYVAITVSFAINIWATHRRPSAAFYFLIPRAWELLLGAILAIKALPPIQHRIVREIAGFTGLGLIARAVSVLTKDTAFPGAWALLPCLGAWLIIYAGETGPSSVKTILSFRPLVFIGVISYSLYLWHWPIIVFAKIFWAADVGNLSPYQVTGVILLSLVMAFVSYEFIESPFRGGNSRIKRRQIFSFGLVATALSAVLGFSIYLSKGFPGRFNDSTRQLISKNMERKKDFEDSCGNWNRDVKSVADLTVCSIGEPSAKKIMFWGDSHVQQLYPLVRQMYDKGELQERGVVFTVAPGCSPSEQMNRPEPGYHCDAFSHFAMIRSEQEDIDAVFIGFAPPDAQTLLCPSVDDKCVGEISNQEMRKRLFEGLSGYIQQLRAHGKRVILSLSFPMFDKSPPDLQIRNAMLPGFPLGAPMDLVPASTRSELASLAKQTGAVIFDPKASLCRGRDCVTQVDGVSIYKDDNHLAASGVGILQENLESTLRKALPAQ